jgi:hypothetical protein
MIEARGTEGDPVAEKGKPEKDTADKGRTRKAERGTSLRERLRVPAGEPVDLSRHDAAATPGGPDDKGLSFGSGRRESTASRRRR